MPGDRGESHPFGDAVTRFDLAADRAFEAVRTPALDRAAYAASAIGDWSVLWHLVGGARAEFRCVNASAAFGVELDCSYQNFRGPQACIAAPAYTRRSSQ